ncbi:MAG: 16S rRNA (cytidine(1402)-2'-O)-methyltransferase [Deltaproteobacteria bacterium]|nr:16S rRNA (cytidine(1402)-2'-O)-methyltransferase [Deltaproteobacteria bacterium]
MTARQAQGTLYVVGTPIGNLEDITLRAIRVLREVDLVAAEDTRVTSRLCRRHDIDTQLVSFREQNAKRMIPKLLSSLDAGEDVALVTDAGTPSVSDPGVDLVTAARNAGITVTPIPGPSALAASISVAGLLGAGVRFLGFLPRSGRRRKERIQAIAMDPALTVLYEAPSRIRQTLTDLSKACGPRSAAVMRELTKIHEEIVHGTLEELAERFKGEVKGEVTLVLAGADMGNEPEITDERLREIIRAEMAKGRTTRDVATSLSQGLGLPKKKIYEMAVDEISLSGDT